MPSIQTSTLLAQIAPQRSTQYAALATALAPVELRLSRIGSYIESIDHCTLGGQTYLHLALSTSADKLDASSLGALAMTSAYFYYHQSLGDVNGPFLQPLETGFVPSQPPELVSSRRYRGKTNELFTHWLCNVAKFSSAFVDAPWESISVLDPLAGGGTTLFTGLMLGAKTVAGIEQDAKDGKSTASYLKQFADENRIPVRVKEERLKKLGRRWAVSLGQSPALFDAGLKQDTSTEAAQIKDAATKPRRNAADYQTLTWAQGDASNAQLLLPGFKPHLVVADLPYGIQHQGQLTSLLETALPRWLAMTRRGGTIALAWDATRFTTPKMHDLLDAILAEFPTVNLLNEPPYNELAHQVDRVIKSRDVAIMRVT